VALFISTLTVCVTARFDGNMQFWGERQKQLYSSHNLEDSASSFLSLCALCVSFHMLQMAGILPSKGVSSFPGYTPCTHCTLYAKVGVEPGDEAAKVLG